MPLSDKIIHAMQKNPPVREMLGVLASVYEYNYIQIYGHDASTFDIGYHRKNIRDREVIGQRY